MSDESIFATAVDISDSGRRAAYLDAACAGDPDRRARVEGLITAHRAAGSFLEAAPGGPGEAVTRTAGAPADDNAVAEVLARLAPSERAGALGRLGHYDVLEVLGRGGFGVVFRAFDDVLHRVVAVKVMAPAMAATSPARKRFIREAQASAAVRHENVVQVYAVEEQPLPHIVMEFIPGETLQQKLTRTGPLAPAEVVRIGREIAEGLAAAHEQGLIHRDVKPANVLIESGPHERVKLTDFGLARAADDASLTQSGAVAGTPLFMSPEQARGAPLDCRSDLFSLGSVLYTLCTGRPPFRAPSAVAVLRRVVEEPPRPIREIIPEVPQWLCDIIETLHAKNPGDRFQTAREVADLLADCLSQLKTDSVLRDPSRIPRPRAARRRWPWAAGLATAAGVAVAVYALRPGPQPPVNPDRAEPPGISPAPPAPGAPPVAPPPRPVAPPPLRSVPFDGATVQAEWAKYLGREVEFADTTLRMEFRVIPPGEFLMGSSPEQVDPRIQEVEDGMPPGWTIAARALRAEKPQRSVRITRPFAIGKCEVTVEQFGEFVKDKMHTTTAERTGGFGFEKEKDAKGKERDKLMARDKKYDWRTVGYKQAPTAPVWNVSYEDAGAFCRWLSLKEGRTVRLPTEAEWEWACRGGTATRTFWADLKPGDMDAYAYAARAGSRPPQEVGRLRPNPFGLHDTCGNVWEWCADWFGEKHYADTAKGGLLTDPKGPGGPDGKYGHRVQRGGSAAGGRFAITSTARHHMEQELCGFRVLLELDPK